MKRFLLLLAFFSLPVFAAGLGEPINLDIGNPPVVVERWKEQFHSG